MVDSSAEAPLASVFGCPRCGREFRRSPGEVDVECARTGVKLSSRQAGGAVPPDPGLADTNRPPAPAFVYCRADPTERLMAGASRTVGAPTAAGDLVGETPHTPRARRLSGRYRLGEQLGAGGMGVVFAAWDEVVDRAVAVKLLAGAAGPDAVVRFQREAQTAGRLQHNHAVRVFDFGQDDDTRYLVMEQVDGPSLAHVLAHRGVLPLDEAARIVAAVARAVDAAHTLGILHRDIKPSNILIRADGTPLLADFGLARDPASAAVTRSEHLLGTPAYMAPEQLSAGGRAGSPADIYALGAVLYEALSGRRPHPVGADTGDTLAVLRSILEQDPLPVSALRPEVPSALAVIVACAMERSIERRYPSAAVLADDLDRFRRGERVWARAPSATRRLGRRAEQLVTRSPRWSWAVLVVGLLGIGQAVRVVSRDLAKEKAERHASARLKELEAHLDELREGGRHDEADAALRGFLAAEENRGTRARADAWLHEGDRLASLGEISGALAAHADAFVVAPEPSLWIAAARALARDFEAADDPAHLLAVASWANAAGADWAPEAQQQARLALRQLDTLAAAPSAEGCGWRRGEDGVFAAYHGQAPEDVPRCRLAALAPILRRLSVGTPLTGWAAVPGPTPDQSILLATDPPSPDSAPGAPSMSRTRAWSPPVWPATPVGTVEIPRVFDALWPLDLAPSGRWLLGSTWGERARLLLPLGEPAGRTIAAFDADPPLSAVVSDLNRDGAAELYVGVGPYGRRLVRLRPDQGWRLDAPSPTIDAAGSDVTIVAAEDLDEDGQTELLVAGGPWRAWDLSVLRAEGDILHRVFRLRTGSVGALGRVGDALLLCVQSPPDGVRSVLEPGLHPYRFTGSELIPTNTQVTPRPAVPLGAHDACQRVEAGDLDGDGLDDLVVGVSHGGAHALVWRGGPEGLIGPVRLGGVRPTGIWELDGRSGGELVVGLDNTTWALGLGDQHIPPRTDTPTTPAPRQWEPTGDPVLDGGIARAETLVALGLGLRAALRLEELAGQAPEATASGLYLRAAEMYDSERQHEAATGRWAMAAKNPDFAAAAWLGHARSEAAAGDHRAALSTLAHARAAARPGLDDALIRDIEAAHAAWTPLVSNTRLQLGGPDPLPAAVRLVDPGAVMVDTPTGDVWVTLVAGLGEVLRVPVSWAGGRLALGIDLVSDRVEWGFDGGWSVGTREPDHVMGIGIGGRGGAGRLALRWSCTHPQSGAFERTPVPVPEVATPLRLSARIDVAPDGFRCVREAGGAGVDRAMWGFQQPFPTGVLWLVLDASGDFSGTLARLRIREASLEGSGLEVPSAPGERDELSGRVGMTPEEGERDELSGRVGMTPEEEAHRALALGRLVEALARYRALAPSIARDHGWMIAALRAGVDVEARGAAERLAHDEAGRAALIGVMRRETPTLMRAMGATPPAWFAPLFWRAWQVTVGAHPDDPLVQNVLIGAHFLDDPHLDPDIAAPIRLARGAAWLANGRLTEAARDLQAARGRVDPAAEGRLALRLRLAEGDVEGAVALARVLIEAAPAPEILADELAEIPELAGRLSAPPAP